MNTQIPPLKQDPEHAIAPLKIYDVEGMDCAHCAQTMSKGIRSLKNVLDVEVDFVTGKMRVRGDVDDEAVRQRTETLGYRIAVPREDATADARGTTITQGNAILGFARYIANSYEGRFALGGAALGILGLILSIAGVDEGFVDGVLTAATLTAVYPIGRSGLTRLFINRDININLLMTIAAGGALIIGEFFEAIVVIFLFAVGESLEGYTADRARDSIRSLMTLSPAQATRINADGETVVPVESLEIGDHILIKPGERVPMDGQVLSGESDVNQAPVTGESVPVMKTTDDDVYAGTVNGGGVLTVEVTRLAEDNTINRIIKMVEEAQSVRAPSQRMIDRFAQVYTPLVVALAAGIAFIPPLFFGQPFWDTPDAQGWLYRALTLLVIACPCALVISAPVTVISAITSAARRGVLIKGGAHLEALGTVNAIAFDKTGTLTHGKPKVMTVRSSDCATGEACDDCDDLLALASALESRSTHPLAQAVVNAATERQLEHVYPPAENVQNLAGRGVQGNISGELVTVGSHAYFDTHYPHENEFCQLIHDAEAAGQTTMLVNSGDKVRGFIGVADEVREDSHDVVSALHQLGLQTVMLTGDNPTTAQAVGSQVGVKDVRSGLLPEDKVSAVSGLRDQFGTVAMIGDGVNDVPALAAATVGVAMGGAGTAQAMETADVVLMADDLHQLPFAVRLSRFARNLIRQNIALSLGVKLVFILLAVFFTTSLWLAIFADVGMLLIVTLNGMRPLRYASSHIR